MNIASKKILKGIITIIIFVLIQILVLAFCIFILPSQLWFVFPISLILPIILFYIYQRYNSPPKKNKNIKEEKVINPYTKNKKLFFRILIISFIIGGIFVFILFLDTISNVDLKQDEQIIISEVQNRMPVLKFLLRVSNFVSWIGLIGFIIFKVKENKFIIKNKKNGKSS